MYKKDEGRGRHEERNRVMMSAWRRERKCGTQRDKGGTGRAKHERLVTMCVRDATAAAGVCFGRISDEV
jgi:hypothetical protein